MSKEKKSGVLPEKKLPYGLHWVDDSEISEVVDTLKYGYLTSGPNVELFERKFAKYTSVDHAVAVSSCTAALHLILVALGIGKGDEVITTDMSYVATSNSILYVDAKPVFVDIDANTLNIDPSKIEKCITPKTGFASTYSIEFDVAT